MIEYATIEQVLQFHKVPCQVITSRTGGGYCDYILKRMIR